MRRLGGRTAVVTGAASGIGRAMADAFVAEGMRVVLADIEADRLGAAVAELEAGGHDVAGVPTDVTDYASVEALRDEAIERYGNLHVVCNNAGVGGTRGPSWELTLDDWAWTINVNLWGVIHGEKAFVPHLIGHGEEGVVVNTASLAGHFANAGMAEYTATKYAVVAMSECLHHELRAIDSAIRVSVLCPPFVATNIHDSERNRPAELSDTRERTPEEEAMKGFVADFIARGRPPEDMAAAVVEAIHEDRFWVIPEEIAIRGIEARWHTIRDGADPFDPMAAFRARS